MWLVKYLFKLLPAHAQIDLIISFSGTESVLFAQELAECILSRVVILLCIYVHVLNQHSILLYVILVYYVKY